MRGFFFFDTIFLSEINQDTYYLLQKNQVSVPMFMNIKTFRLIAPVMLSLSFLAGYPRCAYGNCMPPELRKTEKKAPAEISSLPKLFAVSIIRLFQVTGSKAEGPRCAFRPTCSAYGKQAVRRFGALRGGVMIFDRLMRCHYCAGFGGYPVYKGRGGARKLLDPVWQNDFW